MDVGCVWGVALESPSSKFYISVRFSAFRMYVLEKLGSIGVNHIEMKNYALFRPERKLDTNATKITPTLIGCCPKVYMSSPGAENNIYSHFHFTSLSKYKNQGG